MAEPDYSLTATAPPAPATTHTAAEEEYLADLHRTLKPEARLAYINYFLARTPAHLQEDMKDLIEADIPVEPETPAPPPVEPVA